MQNKKTAAHTLQARYPCKNPEATERRKTSAKEKAAVKLKPVQRKKTAVKLKPTETISNIDGMS